MLLSLYVSEVESYGDGHLSIGNLKSHLDSLDDTKQSTTSQMRRLWRKIDQRPGLLPCL